MLKRVFARFAVTAMTIGGIALTAAPGRADAEAMTIQLNERHTATIATDEDAGTLTATIFSGGELSTSVTLGNASFHPHSVKQVVLCRGCDPSYFIPAWDRSSTYGATTGLVLWGRGWWTISILPLSVAGIEDPDGDGVTMLRDFFRNYDNEPVRFTFKRGRLIDAVEDE